MKLKDKNILSVETYNNAAKNYQDKFMEMDLYNDTFNQFCDLIKADYSRIFEIACGPGNVTKYLKSINPTFQIKGIDLAPKMIELAKINNPDVNFEIMDCRKIDTINEIFDAIMCGFCLPYLSKEECSKLIKDSSNLLNRDGLLYLSTMEGDYDKSGFEKTSFSGENEVYIHYHQADFLKEQLKKFGFEIISLVRKDYPEPDGTFLTDMIFIARKK
ncbi:methyltransferase domain-containing protein [Maribacter sp.]|uniref:class I SAM-dependent DNA methyltransferase n=1 Tax=Maribacter sp. TaxID=1897614 RepID=UPI00329955D6